jgi:yecA family protein
MSDIPTDTSMAAVKFDELADSLAPLGTLNSPSELQGLLCGKLCGGAVFGEVEWLLEAVEFLDFTQAPDESIRNLLTRLFYATRAQLRGDFALELMLPDDDTEMEQRLDALSQWCHGFLTGFGSAGVKQDLSEEARDTLEDLAALVQVAADDEDDSEADYMEVTEYVRVAAASLYYEFAPAEPTSGAPAVAPTLH